MTKNSTATKWGSTIIEQITPVHHTIHKDGFRTAIVMMPAGAHLSEQELDKLTEIGLGLQGFRGVRFSLKHERFFIDFTPKFTDRQITDLVSTMLHQMGLTANETPAAAQSRPMQKSSVPAVRFSSS